MIGSDCKFFSQPIWQQVVKIYPIWTFKSNGFVSACSVVCSQQQQHLGHYRGQMRPHNGGFRHLAKGSTSCGGSRLSARGGNLICFPVSHIYFFVGGGQSLWPNWMGGAMALDPLDPPLKPLWQSGHHVRLTYDVTVESRQLTASQQISSSCCGSRLERWGHMSLSLTVVALWSAHYRTRWYSVINLACHTNSGHERLDISWPSVKEWSILGQPSSVVPPSDRRWTRTLSKWRTCSSLASILFTCNLHTQIFY